MYKQYIIPIAVYLVSLGLIYQTSMIGSYIIGVDIHTEYYVANQIIKNGWDWTWANNSNTSIVLGLFTPLLYKVGIPVVWQFKAIYPAICALAPVILYLAFKPKFGTIKALIGTGFFIIMPMYSMEVVSMVKSQVAYVFMALFVFFTLRVDNLKIKIPGLILSAILAAISHYAVGVILLFYSFGMLIIILIQSMKTPKLLYKASALIIIPIIFTLYYANISQGSILNTITAIPKNLLHVSQDIASGNNTSLVSQYTEYTTSEQVKITTSSYLNYQSPLIRMAIGLDFNEVSKWGKVFRILQITTEILLVIGIIILLKRRKEFPKLYIAGILSSFFILLACIFVPFFTTALSPTRFYAVTLMFIAPLISLTLDNKWTIAILILYAIFTTGIMFELTKSTITDKMDIPYSIALSNDRVKIVGEYNLDDIKVIEWLNNHNGVRPVYTDYLGTSLLLGYDSTGRNMYIEPKELDHYVLLTSWNVENNKMVDGWFGGQRSFRELESINGEIIFQSGSSKIYYVEGVK